MYVRQRTWLDAGPGCPKRIGGRVVMPRYRSGLGSTAWDIFMSEVPGTKQFCDDPASLLSPFQAVCLPYDVNKKLTNVISPTVAPPAPAPPSIAFVDPSTPGATYAGDDQNGSPVYVLPQTPQENAAANRAAQTGFFSDYAAANPATDCSGFFNSTFNPTCGASLWTGALAIGVTVLGIAAFLRPTR